MSKMFNQFDLPKALSQYKQHLTETAEQRPKSVIGHRLTGAVIGAVPGAVVRAIGGKAAEPAAMGISGLLGLVGAAQLGWAAVLQNKFKAEAMRRLADPNYPEEAKKEVLRQYTQWKRWVKTLSPEGRLQAIGTFRPSFSTLRA